MLSRLAACCLLLPALASQVSGTDLDTILHPGGRVWQLAPERFLQEYRPAGFRWVSDRRETARSAQPGQEFMGLPVYESSARFGGERLESITLSLYNRGDAGQITAAAFDSLLATAHRQLSGWAGHRGVALQDEQRSSAVVLRRRAWVNEPHTVLLAWSFTPKSRAAGIHEDRPEYVRLKIAPFDPDRDPRKMRFALPANQRPVFTVNVLELRARAKRTADGDVVIDSVPMVDQGTKGYCAAAVSERLLRYYGRNIDQHEIAQIANTDAGLGTSPEQMVRALRRIGSELGLNVHTHQDFELDDFQNLVRDYNRLARRRDQPEIEYGYVIDLRGIYEQFDTALLIEARARRSGSRDAFREDLKRSIDAGAPLAWGVMLGKITETPPLRMSGGHMRLIIGYNDRSGEVLYSDTWGRGHEQKRMSLDDAWAITMGLYTVHPNNVRF